MLLSLKSGTTTTQTAIMDPPAHSFRDLSYDEDEPELSLSRRSMTPEPSSSPTPAAAAAAAASSETTHHQEEKVSLDNEHAGNTFVEAMAELVVENKSGSSTTTSSPLAAPSDMKLPASSFPSDLRARGIVPPPPTPANGSFQTLHSRTSATTAAAAAAGTAARRPAPMMPNYRELQFKDQVRDCTPPLVSSRNVQTVQTHPDAARREHGRFPGRPSMSDSSNSSRYTGTATTTAVTEGTEDDRAADAELRLHRDGFPDGLARHLVYEVKSVYPLRFWCIDNSASMYKDDCRRFVHGSDNNLFGGSGDPTVKCTRWLELQETAKYHARLSGRLGATTIFRLLNHYSDQPREYVVNREDDADRAIAVLDEIQPDGVSLLTQHVSSIRERIEAIEPNLRKRGQKAVVVLATDGLPSDQFGETTPELQGDFIESLKQLQLLPVWIVIRLCTTDRDVLNFYRLLDKELERPIDVLGGFLTEAKEVYRLNKWLNYALPLHRAREMGLASRLPDLLDEREFTKDECREMVELLFDKEDLVDAPNMHTDWYQFVDYLKDHVLTKTGMQWNSQTKRVESWIDCGKLKSHYGGGLMAKKDKLVLGMQRAFSKDVI